MLNDNEAKRRVSESLSKDGRIQEDNQDANSNKVELI